MENKLWLKEILTELKCPVCFEYLSPPIRQCIIGHALCSSCFERCTNCPTCRAPKGSSRCFTLEKIYAKIIFPCRNEDNGCSYRNKGPIVKEHEEWCQYNIKECPLNVQDSCKWLGPAIEFLAHCKNEHANQVYISNYQIFTWQNFNVIDDVYYCKLLQAYEHLFRFTWYMDATNGVIQICLYHFGFKKDSKRFVYEVKFNTNQMETFSLEGQCEPYCEGSFIFENGSYLMTDFDTIRIFCDEKGALKCTLVITDLLRDEIYVS